METPNTPIHPESQYPREPKAIRTICGFWRRLFAFFVDSLILGVFGLILGMAFFNFFAELGSAGRLFGFTVALLYFGIQNSSLCDGQTIGKRIFNIKVVDHDMNSISPQRSFARFTILGFPYFLNGALFPPTLLNNFFLSLFIGLIVFFGLFGIVYLYIFNRKTRQSLHDLIVGTYVVNATAVTRFSFQPLWKGHLAVLSVLFLSILIVMTIVVPKLGQKNFFKELLAVQQRIQETGLVHATNVSAGKSYGTSTGTGEATEWETTFFKVTAVLKQKPSKIDMTINEIANVVLATYPPIMEKDALVINVSYGYDIGIARAWRTQRRQNSPKEWQRLLFQDTENI